MKENRIWKLLTWICMVVLSVVLRVPGNAQEIYAKSLGNELESGFVSEEWKGEEAQIVPGQIERNLSQGVILQNARWTDREQFKALLTVQTQNLQWGEAFHETDEDDDRELEAVYNLVVWISEYFQLDRAAFSSEGYLMEEIPVQSQDGRMISITKLHWKLGETEMEKEQEIPVILREEYRFLADEKAVPLCQDSPLEKGTEADISAYGTYIEEKRGAIRKIVREGAAPVITISSSEAKLGLLAGLREEQAIAGNRIFFDVKIENKGSIPIYGLALNAKLQGTENVPVWENEPGFKATEEGALLESLREGEVRNVSFFVDIGEKEQGEWKGMVTAVASELLPVQEKAEFSFPVLSGKAAFTVKKTADRKTAQPGETITYQISIHNTGECTLHSVVSTERFGISGIYARFQEQEGILLNQTKTQARISEIVPGGCVNLKAQVVLPEELEDQDLINQVIVVSDETGEEKRIRDQSVVKVENKEQKVERIQTGDGSCGKGQSSYKDSPQTGDRSHKEFFQLLIVCSLLFSAVIAGKMFFDRRD